MAIQFEAPDSYDSGGAFLNAEGVFHLAVLDVTETPTKRDGSLIANAAFGVDLEVLAGPHAKKQKDIVFFNPDASKPRESAGYQLSLRKVGRFLEATGVVAERVPGGQTYTVDPTKAKGRQLIARFAFDEREGKEKNLQLAFADIWHIDDPAAPQCERNQDAIKLLPKSLRRDPASFAKPARGSDGSGNGAAHAKQSAPQSSSPPAATAAAVDLNDI